MSNEDAPKPQFRIDQEKQNALKLTTDIAYANKNFIYHCCTLADESYGLGRVVINDDGRKLGTREVFAQMRELEFAKKQFTVSDFKQIDSSIAAIEGHLSWIKKSLENLKTFGTTD
jgi:hypothetical protein